MALGHEKFCTWSQLSVNNSKRCTISPVIATLVLNTIPVSLYTVPAPLSPSRNNWQREFQSAILVPVGAEGRSRFRKQYRDSPPSQPPQPMIARGHHGQGVGSAPVRAYDDSDTKHTTPAPKLNKNAQSDHPTSTQANMTQKPLYNIRTSNSYETLNDEDIDNMEQDPHIEKEDTNMRLSIPARERLTVTLRYLATGESYQSLMYSTRIPACTISKIIPECCEAIYNVLKDKHLKVPNNEEGWNSIAHAFLEKWNIPNCLGALDGKHVEFEASKQSGSMYWNYKQSNSIVLLALVDANYNFIYVHAWTNGRIEKTMMEIWY
ncbi:uncharacterized protein CBL_10597 [Carabus blaptoides fortunei]